MGLTAHSPGCVRHPGRWLLLICGASLLLKAGFLIALGTWGRPQVWEYEAIAVNVAEGRGYRSEFLHQPYRSEIQPLYPLVCAALYRVFGHDWRAIQIFQVAIATVLCLVIFDIGRQLVSVSVGLVAAFLVAWHPGLSYYATGNLHVLVFDAWLFAMVVWAFLRLEQTFTWPWILTSGLCLGLALLSRASVLVFIPFGLAWLWWRLRNRMATLRLRGGLLVLSLLTGLVVAPWLVRNYHLHGRFPYFLSTVGSGLWTGNNPNASGSTLTPEGRPVRFTAPPGFLERLYQLSEVEQDAYFKQAAMAYITTHPARAMALYAKKLWAFWWFSPQSGLEYPKTWLRLYKIWYMIILLSFFIGLYGTSKQGRWPRVVVLVAFGWSVALCQSVFYVEGRHRWEIEALMLVIAAAGVLTLVDLLSKRSQAHASSC